MNTHSNTGASATKRLLALMIAAGALTFSACGTDSSSADGAPPVGDSGYWDGSLYPRTDGPGVRTPHDGESVRAPRAMGGDPTLPTGSQPPGSVI